MGGWGDVCQANQLPLPTYAMLRSNIPPVVLVQDVTVPQVEHDGVKVPDRRQMRGVVGDVAVGDGTAVPLESPRAWLLRQVWPSRLAVESVVEKDVLCRSSDTSRVGGSTLRASPSSLELAIKIFLPSAPQF